MTTLRAALELVPRVYADLGTAMVPGGSSAVDGERVSGGGQTEAPAPARLEVAEHRHLLLRGLRWWVDVLDPDTTMPVGDSPAKMCAVILGNLHHLDTEDAETLRSNLTEWLHAAYPFIGETEAPRRPVLPAVALDAVVPVHVAAKVLGVSTRTIQRRAPGRETGRVRLRDVCPLCPHGLPVGHCGDCAP